MSFKLVNNNKYVPYNQNSQVVPVEFAYAKIEGDKVIQQHHQVRCRDFLGDTLIWNAKIPGDSDDKPIPESVYGYDYKGVPEANLVLYRIYAPENLKLLNEYEKELGMTPSTLEKLEPSVYLIQGDPKWVKTTFHISFWTFLIRTLLGESVPNWKRELQGVGIFSHAEISPVIKLFQERTEKLDDSSVWPSIKEGKYLFFHSTNGFASLLNWPQNYRSK